MRITKMLRNKPNPAAYGQSIRHRSRDRHSLSDWCCGPTALLSQLPPLRSHDSEKCRGLNTPSCHNQPCPSRACAVRPFQGTLVRPSLRVPLDHPLLRQHCGCPQWTDSSPWLPLHYRATATNDFSFGGWVPRKPGSSPTVKARATLIRPRAPACT